MNYYCKHCPSLATTFGHLSVFERIPYRKKRLDFYLNRQPENWPYFRVFRFWWAVAHTRHNESIQTNVGQSCNAVIFFYPLTRIGGKKFTCDFRFMPFLHLFRLLSTRFGCMLWKLVISSLGFKEKIPAKNHFFGLFFDFF